ncbi:hypothetical protein CFP56_026518 [Quercus suber]|uniref:Uncharacterized protein n=1 Tax=Quercus suber TaxID=58331 RepID=A0AAW0K090_QUESU
MASVLCSAPITSFNATPKPGKCMSNDNNQKHAQYDVFQNSPAAKFGKLKAKAAKVIKVANRKALFVLIVMEMVQFNVRNAKVVELTLLTFSMDSSKLVTHVGFAVVKRRCYVEIAMEQVSLEVS